MSGRPYFYCAGCQKHHSWATKKEYLLVTLYVFVLAPKPTGLDYSSLERSSKPYLSFTTWKMQDRIGTEQS